MSGSKNLKTSEVKEVDITGNANTLGRLRTSATDNHRVV
jgi:hypothetical protein